MKMFQHRGDQGKASSPKKAMRKKGRTETLRGDTYGTKFGLYY